MVLAKIDSRGRLGIPKKLREEAELNPGQLVDITKHDNGLLIRRAKVIIENKD